MPEARFYVPDYQFETLIAFKKMFGRNWGQLLLEFMTQKVRNESGISKKELAEKIFNRFFGDIVNEREFITMMSVEGAQSAIRHRVRDACAADKELFDDVIDLLREKLPRLAELGGYKK